METEEWADVNVEDGTKIACSLARVTSEVRFLQCVRIEIEMHKETFMKGESRAP